MDLYGELEWRGLVYDATEGLRDVLARERVTAYAGFDPTASSLHAGHILPIMALARAQRLGHSPIALVGGGTGLIGDPSGKTAERQLLASEQVEANVGSLRGQLARFLDFENTTAPARLVNNAEWLTRITAVEFMRDVGKHFSVNAMLAKESVKRRIESEEGISYTEFSYSLLQAYDFLVLYDRFGCTLQLGGSDQWGNITAGMDLVRRLRGGKAHGLVMPLLTTAAGTKFGKTESGSVWLDPGLTKPYEFYQFWLNTDDRDAVRYLKFFTFLPQERVMELEREASIAPEKRIAQRELAREVTRLVHGPAAVAEAEAAAEKLFAGNVASMSTDDLRKVFATVRSLRVPFQPDGWRVQTFMVDGGLAKSLRQATQLIESQSVHVNGRPFTQALSKLKPSDAVGGQLFLIRKGKKDYLLVEVGSVGVVDIAAG